MPLRETRGGKTNKKTKMPFWAPGTLAHRRPGGVLAKTPKGAKAEASEETNKQTLLAATVGQPGTTGAKVKGSERRRTRAKDNAKAEKKRGSLGTLKRKQK